MCMCAVRRFLENAFLGECVSWRIKETGSKGAKACGEEEEVLWRRCSLLEESELVSLV